jgi:hypothetical protein
LFHPFTTLEESQLENHESWHDAYNVYENLINDVCLKFIYTFKKRCAWVKILGGP